jgi:hypothetical protein
LRTIAIKNVGHAHSAPARRVFAAIARVIVAILVIVQTTIGFGQAVISEVASSWERAQWTTFANNRGESVDIDVVSLRKARILRPDRAIPVARVTVLSVVQRSNDRSTETRLSVIDGNLATVLPDVIGINTEFRITRKCALHVRQVAI